MIVVVVFIDPHSFVTSVYIEGQVLVVHLVDLSSVVLTFLSLVLILKENS